MKKNRALLQRELRKKPRMLTRKFLYLLICLLFLPGLTAKAQNQERIDLKMQNVKLTQIIDKLRDISDLTFTYQVDDLKPYTGISLDLKQKTVPEILDECLNKTNLAWKQVDNTIIIYKRPSTAESKSITIKGFILDQKKISMPGVTVKLVGTNVGTATDTKGWFAIKLPVTKGKLEFSFVGYISQTVNFTQEIAKDTMHIILKEDVINMDEVVITGYQAVKKKAMTGSFSKVDAKNLTMTGTETVEQMLQGQLPGVMVMNTSGLTGTRQKVRVRGTSTLAGNAEPVWVIDGIIQQDPLPFKANELADISDDNMDMIKNFVGGAISWLNPRDIQDITVLKDASASAIYGVKAANGVIVITTKKGERGRLSLSYSGNFSMGERLNYNKLELMNSQERVALSREAYERGARVRNEKIGYMGLALAFQRGEITHEEFDREAKKLEVVNTDWFDVLYQTPFSQSHTASVSGGNDNSTYYASMGYSNNENTAKGNKQTSYTARLSMSSTFWNKLIVNVALSGSHAETEAFATGVDPFNYAIKTSRVIPCNNEDGSLFYYAEKDNAYNYNILNELENSGNRNKSRSLNASVDARWSIIEGLTLSTTLGGASSSTFGRIWFTERSNHITAIRKYEYGTRGPMDKEFKESYLPFGGMLTVNENENFNYTWRNQLEFAKNLGPHAITLMGGLEVSSNKREGYAHTAYGYMPDRGESFIDVPQMILWFGEMRPNKEYANLRPILTNGIENTLSYYLTGSYMYDNRYAFNFSVRSDGSNRFGQDANKKFQPVWSIGGRWNVTDEHWLENQNILNNLSFSATFGYQGNAVDAVSPNLVAKLLPLDPLTGEFKMTYSKLPTPELKWETTKSVNLGANFSILNSKINGSFEYYYKKTTDLITNREIPYENGVSSMYVNGGNMKNSGWELSFSLVPVRTKDFVWSLSFNTSKVFNKVESNLEPTGNWRDVTNGTFNKKGYPVSSFWAFKFTGLNPENGGPQFDFSQAKTNTSALDVTECMVYAGKTEPDLTGGINMNFRYKNWTLGTAFYLSLGNQCFLDSPYGSQFASSGMMSEYENASSQLLKRWKKPGDVTNIPSIPLGENCRAIYPFNNPNIILYPYEAWAASDVQVVDAWYLRCNSINLSYVFPEEMIRSFAQNVSFQFTVNNPFQIVSSDFDSRDPEVAKGSQPLSRTFSLSLNVSF